MLRFRLNDFILYIVVCDFGVIYLYILDFKHIFYRQQKQQNGGYK